MEDSKRQNKRGRSGKGATEIRIAGIDFNPAPDADDRLRRLAGLLLRLVSDETPLPGADTQLDGSSKEKS